MYGTGDRVGVIPCAVYRPGLYTPPMTIGECSMWVIRIGYNELGSTTYSIDG